MDLMIKVSATMRSPVPSHAEKLCHIDARYFRLWLGQLLTYFSGSDFFFYSPQLYCAHSISKLHAFDIRNLPLTLVMYMFNFISL